MMDVCCCDGRIDLERSNCCLPMRASCPSDYVSRVVACKNVELNLREAEAKRAAPWGFHVFAPA